MWVMLRSCVKRGERLFFAVARFCVIRSMGITKYLTCTALGFALLPPSCAPKATVVVEAPVKIKQEIAPEPAAPELSVPAQVEDGLRMPDMLAMPSEGDFRSTNPAAPKTGNASGAVISRPPADASMQVKPKE
jgi:hypothetical protein